MASCATPRVPKSKGNAGRAGGALPLFRFYLGMRCFFVFLMEKNLLYRGKARVLYRGERKGSETANHPGSLRWLLSVDNAPIRRCVPRNAIPFTRRNPKLREIPGCTARPRRMYTGGGGGWLTWGWAVRRFSMNIYMIALRTCKIIGYETRINFD